MPTTPTWSIFYRNTSTPAALETESATQATSIETALSTLAGQRQVQTYKWANVAARNAQTGMLEGDLGDQADNDLQYRYSGTAWKVISPGNVTIVPASAANASVDTSGFITSTAQTTISVNGCFTTDFDWYEIIFDCTMSAASGIDMQLRAGGVNAVTAYDNQRFSVVNTSVAGLQSLNISSLLLSTIGVAGRHVGKALLMNPALAAITVGSAESVVTPNPMTPSSGRSWTGLQHRTATAYDGFSLVAGAGTITINGIRIVGIPTA